MERFELEFYYGQEAEQFTFYRLPKALITDPRFKDISNNAKLLYGLMLDRMGLSVRSGWFDDENRVYIKYAVKSIMEDLNISKMTAVGLLKELQGIGLIDMIQRNGLANIIYVKNFVSEDKAQSKGKEKVLDRSDVQTSKENVPAEDNRDEKETGINSLLAQNKDWKEVQTGTSTENRRGVVQFLDTTKNDSINNDLNDTNHIRQSEMIDSMDEADAYMNLIRSNIEYDIMMSDSTWSDRETFDELYQLICDVVCVPRKSIRVGREDYPYNLVKSKFLKLNAQHLEYVINCMNKNTTKVSNIRAYMITALYNAPSTINHYYQAEVNHDIFSGKCIGC